MLNATLKGDLLQRVVVGTSQLASGDDCANMFKSQRQVMAFLSNPTLKFNTLALLWDDDCFQATSQDFKDAGIWQLYPMYPVAQGLGLLIDSLYTMGNYCGRQGRQAIRTQGNKASAKELSHQWLLCADECFVTCAELCILLLQGP